MISDKTNKENYTVNIRGVEMNLLEARKYLNDLKQDKIKIDLDEREREEYSNIKTALGLKGEKEYLELIVTIPLKIKEMFDQQSECEEKGHLGERVMSTSSYGKAFCRCELCGDTYLRPMNPQENKELRELMKIRYNI